MRGGGGGGGRGGGKADMDNLFCDDDKQKINKIVENCKIFIFARQPTP